MPSFESRNVDVTQKTPLDPAAEAAEVSSVVRKLAKGANQEPLTEAALVEKGGFRSDLMAAFDDGAQEAIDAAFDTPDYAGMFEVDASAFSQ